jgi:hypothetical protein
MTTVMPKGENLRNAIKWIDEARREAHPPTDRKLLDEACLRFNLTPLENEYLAKFIAGKIE